MDRRVIHSRIGTLKAELSKVIKNRDIKRTRRQNQEIPVIAIVGYTNAGKSTLLNQLTGAGILAENRLFATLDPTTRQFQLPNQQEVLLTDTVGFIRKLPHHLVDAFRSTLEEAKYADIILHVVDSANPQVDMQMDIVYETLEQLGVTDKPIITVFNKQDVSEAEVLLKDTRASRCVYISAKTGWGLSSLYDAIEAILNEDKVYVNHILPFAEAAVIARIRREGLLLQEEYLEDGIRIEAYVPKKLAFVLNL